MKENETKTRTLIIKIKDKLDTDITDISVENKNGMADNADFGGAIAVMAIELADRMAITVDEVLEKVKVTMKYKEDRGE